MKSNEHGFLNCLNVNARVCSSRFSGQPVITLAVQVKNKHEPPPQQKTNKQTKKFPYHVVLVECPTNVQ